MLPEEDSNPGGPENLTPSLSLEELNMPVKSYPKNRQILGVRKKEGRPYWQPIRGILRWELRQHYQDAQGKRQTKVLRTRKTKPT